MQQTPTNGSLILLSNQSLKPRQPTIYVGGELPPSLPPTGTIYAIDLETQGVQAYKNDVLIVGIGIAGAEQPPIYIELTDTTRPVVYDWLTKVSLTAFNVMFDGLFLARDTRKWLDWRMCTYIMYRHLATDGFIGQSWSLESAQAAVLGWPQSNKDPLYQWLKENKIPKSEMYKAPSSILGPYCALDAEAAWQLYTVFRNLLRDRAAEWGNNLASYHKREMLTLVRLLIKSYLRGVRLDITRLTELEQSLTERIDSTRAVITQHPVLQELDQELRKHALEQWQAAEPTKLTKLGKIAARWTAWQAKEAVIKNRSYVNINAKQQLEHVFFDKLGYEAARTTETGRRAVDKKILPKLGDLGKALDAYNRLVKEQGYVSGIRELLDGDRLHPTFKVPGTVTGRLSGTGGLNWQNFPKSAEFLSVFAARPGYKLVDIDYTAIEPVVLAEFSQDHNLLAVYNGSRPSDIYLYTGYQIPQFTAKIAKYWTPETSTEESLAKAKKELKKERNLLKTICLASNYNAGAGKIHATLTEQGYDITFEEVKHLHDEYWRVYRQVKQYGWRLKRELESNGGYVINGRGRPLAVCPDKIKDLVNTVVQSSGHDLLLTLVYYVDKLVRERGIDAHPWLVDFHDETIWEVREDQVEQMKQLFVDAVALVNQEINPTVLLRGVPASADTLAGIKCE